MIDIVFGGVEAGGTKFICAVGTSPDNIQASIRIPTTNPDETIQKVIDFFKNQSGIKNIAAIGIASFGPLDLNTKSATFGYITSTPKPGWVNVNLANEVQHALNIPVAIDTDVNGAAFGEYMWGAARGLENFVYITIGTGIGGGGMINGRLIHGLAHPEMGHLSIPHSLIQDPFPGSCPYHGDCLEGLASGGAIEKRYGTAPLNLPDNHDVWELVAGYLSFGIVNIMDIVSPQRIIIGGGIMKHRILMPAIRRKVRQMPGGYLYTPKVIPDMDSYLVPPALGDQSGILGAIALGKQIIEPK